MLTFNQVQTILIYLAEKLHTTDNGLVQKFIKRDGCYTSPNFYYGQNGQNRDHLWYIYKGGIRVQLCWLTGGVFDNLPTDEFLEQLLKDAQTTVNAARDEQSKPYLTRIDNL